MRNGSMDRNTPGAGKVDERARRLFDDGFYCAESVLKAVAEAYGIDSEIVPKIATGFCGGQSGTCGQCGAVSGAIMSLGMLTGRSSPDEDVDRTYEAVRAFLDDFEKRFDTTNCRDLIGCDLSTQEGRDEFDSRGLSERCKDYTEEAARIIVRLLRDHSRD